MNNPPVAADSSAQVGQRLLTLVRSLSKRKREEADNDQHDDTSINSEDNNLREAVDILRRLVAQSQRRGLLHGNVELAEKLLAWSSQSTDVEGGKNRRGKKRSRDRNKSRKQGENDAAGGASLDPHLLALAIGRIFNTWSTLDAPSGDSSGDDDSQGCYLLALIAGNLCTALSTFVQTRPRESNTVTLAEHRLLESSAKTWLLGLEKALTASFAGMDGNSSNSPAFEPLDDETAAISALVSGLRAAAALVCVSGLQLSTSRKLVYSLQRIAWRAMAAHASVQESACRLVVALPLTGTSGCPEASTQLPPPTTPSVLWETCLEDSLSCASELLQSVAPVGNRSGKKSKQAPLSTPRFTTATDHARQSMSDWRERMNTLDAESRIPYFLHILQGLVTCAQRLLEHPMLPSLGSTDSPYPAAQVNLALLFNVCDDLLSFATSCEAAYNSTKKRLRHELLEHGLISITSAVQIASSVKLRGLQLLQTTIDTVGGSTLLPFADRIQQLAFSALLNSSSMALRKVLDPVSAATFLDTKLDSDKRPRQWAHLSIETRTAAVSLFHRTILAFGTEAKPLSDMASSHQKFQRQRADETPFVRAIALVGGSLVEQLNSRTDSAAFSDEGDWGSTQERMELVCAASDCLSACLASGGEFLPATGRALVDSIVNKCLASLAGDENGPDIPLSSSVMASLLSLGAAGVTTPWGDGCSSQLGPALLRTARHWETAGADPLVAMAARAAIVACNASLSPRVPPLGAPVARNISAAGSTSTLFPRSASDLVSRLEEVTTAAPVVNGTAVARAEESTLPAAEDDNKPKVNGASAAKPNERGASKSRKLEEPESSSSEKKKGTADGQAASEDVPRKKRKKKKKKKPKKPSSSVDEGEQENEASKTATTQRLVEEVTSKAEKTEHMENRAEETIDAKVDLSPDHHDEQEESEETEDDDGDLPMIDVDCGPDEEDDDSD